MNIPRRALVTLLYGLGAALLFIPLLWVLGHGLRWPLTWTAALWLLTGPYGLILAVWGRRPGAVVFPMVVMLVAAFASNSSLGFLLTWLAVVGWLRTGLATSGSLVLKSVAEMLLSLGIVGLVTWIPPRGAMSGALTVWAFFLVQSVYFVIFPEATPAGENADLIDPFERARRKAEAILR